MNDLCIVNHYLTHLARVEFLIEQYKQYTHKLLRLNHLNVMEVIFMFFSF